MIKTDPTWDQLPLSDLKGLVLIIGDSNTGKSTLARYLYRKLSVQDQDKAVFFLDGDPGQSFLGPPTTINISNFLDKTNSSKLPELTRRYFIGSISPRGHLLQMIVGISKLLEQIPNPESSVIIHDTTGMVKPALGGFALKTAIIDLLEPETLIVIQRSIELAGLILPYKLSGRTKIIELNVSGFVNIRDREERKKYRKRKFREYFSEINHLEIAWDNFAIFPFPDFREHRLISFEDEFGFTLGLGIIKKIDWNRAIISVMSPLASLNQVISLRIGDICLHPQTYCDRLLVNYD